MNRAFELTAVAAGRFLSACGFQPNAGTTESLQNAGVVESARDTDAAEAVPAEAKGIDGAMLFCIGYGNLRSRDA